MFHFTRRTSSRSPSAAVFSALEKDGLPPGIDAASALGVLESRGRYVGRAVTYIRVFDRARAAQDGLNIQAFGDLDAHPDLVLRSGHVEQDGTVVLNWRAPSLDAKAPPRERADRAMHADDERFVFPEEHRQRVEGKP